MAGFGIPRALTDAMAHPGTAQNGISILRLGFVPLSDCAPIAVAKEMGIFG